jgi:hypothetical protein
VLLKEADQIVQHRPREGVVRRRRAVAGVPQHSHFVPHPHQDDRVLLAAHSLDVLFKAAKARASASRFAALKVLSSSMLLDPAM